LAHPVDWSTHQGSRQFLSTSPNGFLIDSSDLHQQPIGTPTHALRLQCQIPATLVFVEPTQEQIHLVMALAFRMSLTPPAWPARAGMNHQRWHHFFLPCLLAALYATTPLDRKSQTGTNSFTAP
jgi:hypothetical protein